MERGPETERITVADEGVLIHDEAADGSLDLPQRLLGPLRQGPSLGTGNQVQDHLRIGSGLEDRSLMLHARAEGGHVVRLPLWAMASLPPL